MISLAVLKIFDLIFLLLVIYILLSWFPNVKWHKQPFFALKSFSDIFLSPFRKLIPPIGMIDISPIVAFFCLSLLRSFLVQLLYRLGL